MRESGASNPLTMVHSDNVDVQRNRDQRKRQIDCADDGDSVSSLPSTLAAYIHDEHKHSGGLALNSAADFADRHS